MNKRLLVALLVSAAVVALVLAVFGPVIGWASVVPGVGLIDVP